MAYRLHEEIASGGYSRVFRCTSDLEKIDKPLVCKMVCKKRRVDVANEARLHAMLNRTRRVPHLYDAYEDEVAHYLVQEACMGGSLTEYGDILRKEAEVARMCAKVLESLHDIHNAGVIHRDIKEHNVLLLDGRDKSASDIRICDFGSAIEHDGDSEMIVPDIRGTPAFISPEALSCRASVKTDVWGLGIVAYRLLTGGAYPFWDKQNPGEPSISRVWNSILFDKPSFEGYYWEGISCDAKDFVESCLIKYVSDRPSVDECMRHRFIAKHVKTLGVMSKHSSDRVQFKF